MRNPRWFLQTLPQGQVAVPGAEFVVDRAGRVDSIKSVHVSLSSSPLSEDSGDEYMMDIKLIKQNVRYVQL